MPAPVDDKVRNCRDTCAGDANYIACFRNCLDRPVVDLVEKWFGKGAGDNCYGYNQMIINAAYKFDPEFVKYAKERGQDAQFPEILRSGTITGIGPVRNTVQEYYMMPVAPYPPKSGMTPKGILNKEPDLAALKKFVQENPCYKKQLIAKACEQQPAVCDEKFITNAKQKMQLSGPTDSSVTGKYLIGGLFAALVLFSVMKR